MSKKQLRKLIIDLFIIITIILLLSASAINKFGIIGYKRTGNIDIFNIDCICKSKNCNCNNTSGSSANNDKEDKTINDKEDNSINDNKNNDNGINNNQNNNIKEEYHDIGFVSEKEWFGTGNLRIFTNPAYELYGVIAPGTYNEYDFEIKNSNSFIINYSIELEEINPGNMNMQYKLKRNGKYLFGSPTEWVSYDVINKNGLNLSSKSKDKYTLQWKWISSENDTQIGYNPTEYTLKIQIKATA